MLLGIVIFVLFALNIFVGSVSIPVADTLRILMGDEVKPSWQYIILESRLPQAITALLAGGALAVSGLMLQTAFRNPLIRWLVPVFLALTVVQVWAWLW